jgi:hypothetical protein
MLPKKRRCTSQPPSEYSYCGGNGLVVTITSACGVDLQTTARCPAGSEVGPLAEINIEATPGYIVANEGYAIKLLSDSQQAVTDRGLRLGDSLKTLRRKYTTTSKTVFGVGECPGTGASYTALAGRDTIVFSVEGGAVEMISLFAGREPHLCTN